MAEDISLNEALQELSRFENVWQATHRLKEALHTAVGLETTITQLTKREAELQDLIQKAQSDADAASASAKQVIDEADRNLTLKLHEFEQTAKEREQAFGELLTRTERDTTAEIAKLNASVEAKREETHQTLDRMGQEIARKQAIVDDLDAQLETFRERLG